MNKTDTIADSPKIAFMLVTNDLTSKASGTSTTRLKTDLPSDKLL